MGEKVKRKTYVVLSEAAFSPVTTSLEGASDLMKTSQIGKGKRKVAYLLLDISTEELPAGSSFPLPS
jgi:hypothetical protein